MLEATGGPDVLQPREAPLPEPASGEARIRQTTIGVNFVDVYLRSGLYPLPARPAILGLEGAGVVEAVGPDVEGLNVGDRVAYGGFPLGGYAEARNLPATRLLRVPDAIDLRVAGASMLRGLTAHMLLNKVCRLKKGDWLLVHAAAGGLGQFVTRWATRLGYRVIGTAGSPEKAELARAAGAIRVFSHREADWESEVRRLADGKGVQLAVDGVGGAMLARTFSVVRPFGVAASLGQPAGPIPPIPVEALSYPKAIALARPSVLAYCNDPILYRSAASDLFAALADGLVNPVGAEYPLREAARAHADLEAGRTTGSVILTP
jgi:NADPH2:quinone reductase